MRTSLLFLAALASGILASPAPPASREQNSTLQHWLYSSTVDDAALALLQRPDLQGVQALYSWKSLEVGEGVYDFSRLRADYERVRALGKQFWIQLQDRTFNPRNDPVPAAATCDGEDCAVNFRVSGWMAQQWNPAVRARHQALLRALAVEFDGLITGLNLPETAVDVLPGTKNYTNEAYFRGELETAGVAAAAFNKSHVVQYVNFWPDGWNNTNNRLVDSFEYYAAHGVGVGGPDLIPYKPGQVANSYTYIPMYHDRVPIAVVSVQEPDLAEINKDTGKPFTKEEFVRYAVDELRVSIIFWSVESPWLQGSSE
ncbi:hypothetical protein NLG97_g2524 [Lecanicillium saksenae]|uniref:Uncharacterized protein n=1 Tax=Lecanicillium saksenae TaxID=468837 RepID=A0ACC1R434_9HYPO|nr:hypothetical protein NLG97_g2524 [Lecanicillium saksenae]